LVGRKTVFAGESIDLTKKSFSSSGTKTNEVPKKKMMARNSEAPAAVGHHHCMFSNL
jgi:hypothetical protein